ncbi:MAG: hypothetical protein ACRDSP_09980 [Pseudonocardiaceae bacterium]
MSSNSTALRVSAADAAVTVITTDAAVADWLTNYLGSWWTVRGLPSIDGESGAPLLSCSLDADAYRSVYEYVQRQPNHVVEFARKPVRVAIEADAIQAVDAAEQVAYHTMGGQQVTLLAADSLGLCLAAARIVRELIRVQLEADGWAILHASAVVRDDLAVLTVGPKRAGKTTTALVLADDGWQLLANDRVFLHPATLAVLPWPAAAALGIGLLHAHGLLSGVRERLNGGHRLHPTVEPSVVAAISKGKVDGIFDEYGKELKPQFFPHQLVEWLNLHLARSATAGRLLFPRIDPAGKPRLAPAPRSLVNADFFDPTDDDRYPDFLQLARITPEQRQQLWVHARHRAETLPRSSVLLNHDTARSRKLLADLTTT